ncbi:MAG: hypothetical protein WAW67_04560 [Candidatus Omnitrophota bacterium]
MGVKKIGIYAVIMFVALGVAGVVMSIHSQEEEGPRLDIVYIEAEVVSVNLNKSTMVVKLVQDKNAKTYDYRTILVPDEAKIKKGNTVLKLSDLKAGNNVEIAFIDLFGTRKAVSISVEDARAGW